MRVPVCMHVCVCARARSLARCACVHVSVCVCQRGTQSCSLLSRSTCMCICLHLGYFCFLLLFECLFVCFCGFNRPNARVWEFRVFEQLLLQTSIKISGYAGNIRLDVVTSLLTAAVRYRTYHPIDTERRNLVAGIHQVSLNML